MNRHWGRSGTAECLLLAESRHSDPGSYAYFQPDLGRFLSYLVYGLIDLQYLGAANMPGTKVA